MKHLLFVIGLFVSVLSGNATHMRSADILIEPDCRNPLTFRITVVAYLNSTSPIQFGGSELNFGDGRFVIIPSTPAVLRPDLGTNISVASFTTTHTYLRSGDYRVTFIERFRNGGILNIANSNQVAYVTFISFTADPSLGCNNIPVLSIPPLDKACSGVAFFHAPGTYDKEGDSLSYALSIPQSDINTTANYTSPNAQNFYTTFNQGNEEKTGVPQFSIDSKTGLLTWNAPGMVGEYNVAFQIIEWRKNLQTGIYRKLSTTVRDMQIVVESCQNSRPDLIIPKDVCITAGTSINETILGTDPEKDPVKIEVFSELLGLSPDQAPASFTPFPSVFTSSNPNASIQFKWTTNCSHVRSQAYQVVFKITDKPPGGNTLVKFKVWSITVVAPAPQWGTTTLDLVNHFADLKWNPYPCAANSTLQVWRKVESNSFVTSYCYTGLPKFLGYQLITQLNGSSTGFMDTNDGRGLAVGAKYCYRLVAVNRLGIPSLASSEICLGPIVADAPVITHVSVYKTSESKGAIRVSWRSPFNINAIQFPKPYEYEIYRGKGISGNRDLLKVGRINDTTFLDQSLNTEEEYYNYRLVIYCKPQNATVVVPIDTSAIASSVRVIATSDIKQIQLQWRDSVPWTTVVEKRPYHLIYRGIETDDEDKMILLDSVDVRENGFYYVDKGSSSSGGLADNLRYFYRIKSRGSYGNSKIRLLENYSQVASTYTISNLKPCSQILRIDKIDCNEYWKNNNCDQKEFTNRIQWKINSSQPCRKNISGYNVYAAASPQDPFILLATNIKDTVFMDVGLSSFKRCYKISAVDKLGQESLASDSVCNDNCPYFLLPNVFTPNNDGYNDTFRSNFETSLNAGSSLDGLIPCPRFVQAIKLRLYNRWGKEVYHFEDDSRDETRLSWDGKDDRGHPLEAGQYFYRAVITFNVLDESKRQRELKGWVHLLR